MTESADILAELGLSMYLQDFLEQGFDDWYTILDIKESDFDALGVKLGHRRKLQRRIANWKWLSSGRALETLRSTPSEDCHLKKQKTDAKDSGNKIQAPKRKYKRHPRPDKYAPERPLSAHVIFSNIMREEHKGRSLSFTEIAKLVGERWQHLTHSEKHLYEEQALIAKERYNNELAEYKGMDSHKEYTQYLAEFKARQSTQQPDASKRIKHKSQQSTASNSTINSGDSQQTINTPSSQRAESSSNVSHWPNSISHVPTPRSANIPYLTVGIEDLKCQGSPNTMASKVLPGYRESIIGGGHPWREVQRSAAQLKHSITQQSYQLANAEKRRPS